MNHKGVTSEPGARTQFLAVLILLSFIGVTFSALDMVAKNESVSNWIDHKEQEILKKTKGYFSYTGNFVDFEDRLLLDELPNADYSRGGVFLIGSSNLKWATMFWNLPAEQRALIHNYAIGGSGHTQQYHFLRYLIEQRNLLRAGGDKTLVVFGVSYHNVGHRFGPDSFFVNLWQRHGFYTCSPTEGITPVLVNTIYRLFHIERVRIAGFISRLLPCIRREVRRLWWQDAPISPRVHNPGKYNELRREFMGPDWKVRLVDQTAEFARTIDYLRAREVRVAVVLLPQGSWEDNLPFERSYNDEIVKICSTEGVPLFDWSGILKDDDFADSNHPNLTGMEKLQSAFLNIARPHLRRTHALP